MTVPDGLDSKAMMPRAIAARVAYVPGTGFYADGTGTANMRLNFSFSEPARLREGVRRLAGVMEQELAVPARPVGLQEAGWDDLVGVDVAAFDRGSRAALADEGFHLRLGPISTRSFSKSCGAKLR